MSKSPTLSNPAGQTGLVRCMGFWQVWAIGVGAVVGDGIFLYLGQAVQAGGPSSLLGTFVAGVIQMLIMVSMGELAVGMPCAGAMSVWVEKYLGKFAGLFSGLTFSVGWVIMGGSTSIALGVTMVYWLPNFLPGTAGIIFWALVWFSVFVIMNIMGAKIAGTGQLVMVIVLVAIMAGFGIAGLIKGVDTSNMTPFMPNGFGGFTATIPIATFGFMGAACITTAGHECKKTTDLGKALVWSSLTFIIVYCLALFVLLCGMNWQDASMDVPLFTQAASLIFGPVGGHILNLACWVACATCLIMGSIYTPSRIFYSMAQEGYMPKFFAKINPKTHTPTSGLVFIWIVCAVIIIAAAFAGTTVVYTTLVNQAVIAWCLSWGLAIIAGMMYRKEIGSKNVKAVVGWKCWGYPVVPILALVGIVYVLYLSFYDWIQWVAFVIWVVVYVIYYLNIRAKIKAGKIRADVQF